MVEARSLFEAHLIVSDLDRAIRFYRDVLGLALAHITPGREAAFFWIGGRGNAMLGLWTAGPGPMSVTSHIAFRASVDDIVTAAGVLRSLGVTPLDFNGRPTELPVILPWMPAVAIYFRDPDGHLLEYIAMLPQEPRPNDDVVPWGTWEG